MKSCDERLLGSAPECLLFLQTHNTRPHLAGERARLAPRAARARTDHGVEHYEITVDDFEYPIDLTNFVYPYGFIQSDEIVSNEDKDGNEQIDDVPGPSAASRVAARARLPARTPRQPSPVVLLRASRGDAALPPLAAQLADRNGLLSSLVMEKKILDFDFHALERMVAGYIRGALGGAGLTVSFATRNTVVRVYRDNNLSMFWESMPCYILMHLTLVPCAVALPRLRQPPARRHHVGGRIDYAAAPDLRGHQARPLVHRLPAAVPLDQPAQLVTRRAGRGSRTGGHRRPDCYLCDDAERPDAAHEQAARPRPIGDGGARRR